jgi:hypothetical protein
MKLKSSALLVATMIDLTLGKVDLNHAAVTLCVMPETLEKLLREIAEFRARLEAKRVEPQAQRTSPETSAQIREKIGNRLKARILARAGVTSDQQPAESGAS